MLLTLEGKEWQSKGKTWINMSTLPDVGVKLDKVKDGVVQDPQKVLVWLPQKVEERSDGDEDDSEWMVCQTIGIPQGRRYTQGGMAFVRQAMPMWLFVEGRTLELHFCKMRMVPFRPDFKQRMMELSKIESMEQFNDPSVLEAFLRRLMSPDMLSIQQHKDRVAWTLDVRLTRLWWRNVARKNEAMEYSGKPYWKSILHEIRSNLEWVYETFSDYIAQICVQNRHSHHRLCSSPSIT